jgi:NADH dehydrogenase
MGKRVVIAGCGFAGLEAALNLHKMLKDRVEIIGVDKNRFFSFLPYLHRVAAATLEENKVIISLIDFFRKIDSEFFQEEITEIRPEENKIVTKKQTIDYDYLVVALGCKTNFYGIPGANECCFDFRDAEHAVNLSQHIARMFLYARNVDSKEKREKMLRFVVCGGGATGIELVTELKHYVDYLCRKHKIDRSNVELVLVEAMPNILPGLPENLSKKMVSYAENAIKKLGIKLLCCKPVVEVGKDFVKLKDEEYVYSNTVVWCGGLKAHEVIKNSGLKTDRRGFLEINNYLQPTFKEMVLENVYCAGDATTFIDKKTNQPLMKIGRHAVDQGKTSAKNIYADIVGGKKVEYTPRTQATVISLGKSDAVGFYGDRVLKGKIALWLKYWIEDGYLKRYRV